MLTNSSLNTDRGIGKEVGENNLVPDDFSLFVKGRGRWRPGTDKKWGEGELGGGEAAFAEYLTHHNRCVGFIYIARNIMTCTTRRLKMIFIATKT